MERRRAGGSVPARLCEIPERRRKRFSGSCAMGCKIHHLLGIFLRDNKNKSYIYLMTLAFIEISSGCELS